MQTNQVILTSQPDAEPYAANEMNRLGWPARPVRRLAPGVQLFDIGERYPDLCAAWQARPPVFIRHVFPVMGVCPAGDDLAQLIELAAPLCPAVGGGEGCSVQVQLLPGAPAALTRPVLRQALLPLMEAAGGVLEVQRPDWVLSVAVDRERIYFGLSRAADNLSCWPGGACRFAHEPEQISRAEFKLLEAFDLFHLVLPDGGHAVDLGAAPGGWTRVLRQRGFTVAAVDPAQLSPSLLTDPGVTHLAMTAQQYLRQGPEPCDLLVNDMRMDALLSASLMGECRGFLKPGALAIMTLKLPEKGAQKRTGQALERLSEHYRVRGARQLFHNRSEVTVVLQNNR
ncbi:MAG: SAM-dependent methyltransferase [Christensenellales bacterium]